MLIFDQLRKNDPQLRLVAVVAMTGLLVLLGGLWWVQIVSYRDYQTDLQTQSFRTVRIPAVRGQILDRNNAVLAENRPTYNVSLYLEELRKAIDGCYSGMVGAARSNLAQQAAAREKQLGRRLNREEKKAFVVAAEDRSAMRQTARYTVASNSVAVIGEKLGLALSVVRTNFAEHYATRLALPYPVLKNLDQNQIARFQEQAMNAPGVDLEIQSTRVYPHQTTAAHMLGYLRRDESSADGEESFFSYRLPDYRGLVGIEGGFDRELRGRAGAKSVLVNNIGYRQTENIWNPAEQGRNVVLTIDLLIQQTAEKALQVYGPTTRGAVVVMEVNTGDILAMASTPAPNPNHFITGFPPGERQRLLDPKLRLQINRATQENYAPGSIFKTVIGLAVLEAGINPNEQIYNPGHIFIGRRKIDDTAQAGSYDFRRALKLSSNTYFITNGIKAGVERIVRLGEKLRLGERTGLPTRQETTGIFPTLARVRAAWSMGETANLCIGQGAISVTPVQMAVLTAAIANGGKVLRPRLVDRIEPADTAPHEQPLVYPPGEVRDLLGVRPQSMAVLHDAMLADVEDSDGTGRAAAVPGLRICGKTGTAQVKDLNNVLVDHTTWFTGFAPYGNPRYAVVVMVESGASGGLTCAPVASKIFQAIVERERQQSPVASQLAGRTRP
jgi:penicillin-binding protein 2